MTKAMIRRFMLDKRLALDTIIKQQKSSEMIQHIKAHPKYQQAHTVGIYEPIKGELDLTELLSDNKRYFIPKVKGNSMVFQEITLSTTLELSELGILESTENNAYDLPLDILFVPALAISKNGDRIGYGKGFFDQYLKQYRPKWTIGVIYDFQLLDSFETHEEDMKIDEVITV